MGKLRPRVAARQRSHSQSQTLRSHTGDTGRGGGEEGRGVPGSALNHTGSVPAHPGGSHQAAAQPPAREGRSSSLRRGHNLSRKTGKLSWAACSSLTRTGALGSQGQADSQVTEKVTPLLESPEVLAGRRQVSERKGSCVQPLASNHHPPQDGDRCHSEMEN